MEKFFKYNDNNHLYLSYLETFDEFEDTITKSLLILSINVNYQYHFKEVYSFP